MADDPRRKAAVDRLVQLGGLTEAAGGELVDAAVAGAVDQVFEVVNGAGAIPTQVTTMKADQLRFVCARAKRVLHQREVELLFRVPPASARAILTTMRATYEQALTEQFVAAMRADATVKATGSVNEGLTWTITFTEPGTFDTAVKELTRLGVASVADVTPAKRSIVLPQRLADKRDPLALLGLR
jgi:hypothetical protein